LIQDDNPIGIIINLIFKGASNIFVATTCGHFMISHFIQNLNGKNMPTRLIFYYGIFEIIKWEMNESEKDCYLCFPENNN
jgi:hypothetical protein